ncbi:MULTISPECIES: hypothetical protein [unclassified Moorena]|uniref:hypothetical protein n=1 Tax=unclassified Moorena TaxID=2683338 RepID=UPI0013B86CCC|nr:MULTISPECIES: hypothetical protein [unclassified Moorena]NEQ16117.1 hypothetical protein [Moorena sp. SIO3E2]NER89279.1 hypothetical protein [Moorena sp. SIO3A2]NES46787.1 hypothetical protein [Moorena sp. SIO2C4]
MVTSDGEHDEHIFGLVDKNGKIISCKDPKNPGFTVDKKRGGVYIINFDQAFAECPGVTCTIYGYSWISYQMSISVVEIERNRFVCQTSTPDHPQDSGFSFIAVGYKPEAD